MVWRPERTARDHARASIDQSDNAVDGSHLNRLGIRELGHDAWNESRRQRLATTGRSDKQQVVVTSCGNFKRTTRARLSP